MPANSLLLSSSPHIYSGVSTRRLMLSVIIALLPATV
ncbi:MAG TPA: Na+-transporting NADH:ubiquinone oxidoreductase subunit D, partial [Spirochaetia bacterium]|nr:Na+-transporting NADH:ubiquinone oxidoreductase subunit D [Spirochaetia bacterium]